MALKTISIQLDEDLLAKIDEHRGDVPRQRFLARVLEAHIDPAFTLAVAGNKLPTDDTQPSEDRATPQGETKRARTRTKATGSASTRGASSAEPSRSGRTLAEMQAERPIIQKRSKR